MRIVLIVAGIWTGLSIIATAIYSLVRITMRRRALRSDRCVRLVEVHHNGGTYDLSAPSDAYRNHMRGRSR